MQKREVKVTAATQRAREMMLGGVIAGNLAGITVMGLAFAIDGVDGLLTAALAFAAAILFYSIGQWLEVIATELDPMQGMGLVLLSYGVRVVGIAAGLWWILSTPQIAPRVIDGWLVASMAATVFCWVGGVVLVASRQRVPVYDPD